MDNEFSYDGGEYEVDEGSAPKSIGSSIPSPLHEGTTGPSEAIGTTPPSRKVASRSKVAVSRASRSIKADTRRAVSEKRHATVVDDNPYGLDLHISPSIVPHDEVWAYISIKLRNEEDPRIIFQAARLGWELVHPSRVPEEGISDDIKGLFTKTTKNAVERSGQVLMSINKAHLNQLQKGLLTKSIASNTAAYKKSGAPLDTVYNQTTRGPLTEDWF